MEFNQKRRQQFLSEASYSYTHSKFNQYSLPRLTAELADESNDPGRRSIIAKRIATDWFEVFMLRYTAGESIAELRDNFSLVVSAHVRALEFESENESHSEVSPLRFGEIDDYERAMQLISLCYLLHRRDELQRLVMVCDGGLSGSDALYEDLLTFEFNDRYDVDELFYEDIYRNISNSYYRDTEKERITDIEKHLKKWYKGMKNAVWHDSHLNMNEVGTAGYFGYWAIEAAAMAYLLNVNDEKFRQYAIYPADLVDFAKGFKPDETANGGDLLRRVAGGELCTITGYWTTPARLDGRVYFSTGAIMPLESDSPYGATIWQWSLDQSSN